MAGFAVAGALGLLLLRQKSDLDNCRVRLEDHERHLYLRNRRREEREDRRAERRSRRRQSMGER